MGDYHAPTGGLDVAIPRTPTRIVVQTFLIHLFADYAYTCLCELLPRFRNHSFNLRCIQVLLLWHLPEYFFVQIITTLLAFAVEEFEIAQPQGLIQFASFAGLQRFRWKSYRDDVRRITWKRIPFLGAALVGCWIGMTAYFERFRISYHQMTDVGMLGIDHRNGWTAMTGLLAGSLALAVRGHAWYQARNGPAHNVETPSSQLEIEKEDGANDFDAVEIPILNINLEHGIMLIEAFFATIFHQIPLIATHRAISIITLLPSSLVLIAVLTALALKKSRPNIARRASTALRWLLMVVIAWTIFEPSLDDLNELYDASATTLQQWSFRWQVTDRFDRMLRTLI